MRRTAEDGEEGENLVTLRFKEPLSWKAGRQIPLAELLKRLQTLAKELRDLDQERMDVESLTPVAKELAASNLLAHKDRGVKAWTACCLVDILRLCAPNAPFTPSQLKEIFTLFITSTIPALADPSNSWNGQHLYVLQSLATVRSILLVNDAPNGPKLVLHLFTTCFDMLSNPREDLSKNVEHNMAGLLVSLVDESATLPAEVIDIMLAQFLRADPRIAVAKPVKGRKQDDVDAKADQMVLLLRQLPPAYNLAKTVCNECKDRMARYVAQYFTNVVLDAGSNRPEKVTKGRSRARAGSDVDSVDADDNHHDPSADDLKEVEKAHRLLRELWRAAPEVLRNVISQVEQELNADQADVRLLATEAIGDLAAGIGAAGPPPSPVLNPAAELGANGTTAQETKDNQPYNTTPFSPQSFSQSHPGTYHAFLGRRNDKAPQIRAAWALCAGRILSTSGGGIGLNHQDEENLIQYLSLLLMDHDEKVRIAVIEAMGFFTFQDVVNRLGTSGDLSTPGSLLHNLADRVRDKKHAVRVEAMNFLGKLWGVAVRDIAAGNEKIRNLLGPIPSRILDAIYANDADINVLVDRVWWESLVPLGWPFYKKGEKKPVRQDVPAEEDDESPSNQADKMRAERLLWLVADLGEKAKKVFFSLMLRPSQQSKYMASFLKTLEDYNGGVMESNEAKIKQQLGRLIDYFSNPFPEPSKAAEDLWKYAKLHDRRTYSLIRFCIAPESDYRKVYKSLKEIRKRLSGNTTATSTIPDTINLLVYRHSNLYYNRSHVHTIVELSQRAESPLMHSAQEVLKEISARTPEVFKAHAQELYRVLEAQAPSEDGNTYVAALDALKACATFAKKFPEDIPHDRKFIQAMKSYALRGSPPATAKYAVSIMLAAKEKKEMYAKDLLKECVDGFSYGCDHFITRLAAISQTMLLAAQDLETQADTVVDIAINQILLLARRQPEVGEKEWQDEMDEECQAKLWALKILTNRLRGFPDLNSVETIAPPVYQLLNRLVQNDGEISKGEVTPAPHRSRLRLQAAVLLLKLNTKKSFDILLGASAFDNLALVAQAPHFQIRSEFTSKIKKYLGQDRLPSRFYTIVFLLAFDPSKRLKEDTSTWLRARATFYAQNEKTKQQVLEPILPRFLSLLAHHPDFSTGADELAETAQYILFYLKAVATEENLGHLYHLVQRVKNYRDKLHPDMSENLYYMSDLAQAVIRHFEDMHNWAMQAYAGKVRLPQSLYDGIRDRDTALKIAGKEHLPRELIDELGTIVKQSVRGKKRKSEPTEDRPAKKRNVSSVSETVATSSKSRGLPVRKAAKIVRTPKPQKKKRIVDVDPAPSSERRRSGRAASRRKSYIETADSQDDEDMNAWDAKDEGEEEEVEEDEQEGDEDDDEDGGSDGNKRNPSGSVAKGKLQGRSGQARPSKQNKDDDAGSTIEVVPLGESDGELSSAPPSDEDE